MTPSTFSIRLTPLNRGELYWRHRPPGDPRRRRAYLIVSRDEFIATSHSSVMCVPVYTAHDGLLTQVAVGPDEGLAHSSSLHCDEVVTIRKEFLRDFVGSLPAEKLRQVNRALAIALDIDPDDLEDL